MDWIAARLSHRVKLSCASVIRSSRRLRRPSTPCRRVRRGGCVRSATALVPKRHTFHAEGRGGGCARILPVAQGMLWPDPPVDRDPERRLQRRDRSNRHDLRRSCRSPRRRASRGDRSTGARKYRGRMGHAGVGKQRPDRTITNHVTKELIHVDHHINLESAGHEQRCPVTLDHRRLRQ